MDVILNWLTPHSAPQRIELIAEQCSFTLAYTVELLTLLQLRGAIEQVGDGYALTSVTH